MTYRNVLTCVALALTLSSLRVVQAKLRESRGESDEAELLFRANLARLDAQAAEAGAGLAGGAALSTDAVEALVFLAGRCKVRAHTHTAHKHTELIAHTHIVVSSVITCCLTFMAPGF